MPTQEMTCALRLDDATLAAWRDDELAAGELDRIAAHVPTCGVCQARVAEWVALDAALRSARLPEPAISEAWQRLRAAKASGRPPTFPRKPLSLRPMLGALSAAAVVALLIGSFAHLLTSRRTAVNPAATATVMGTPTPIPTAAPGLPVVNGPAMSWHPATLPPGVKAVGQETLTLGMSSSNPSLAYACHAVYGRGNLGLWLTTDHASTWTALPRPPIAGIGANCGIIVDSLDPTLVMLSVDSYVHGNPDSAAPDLTTRFISHDSGQRWTQLSATTYPVGATPSSANLQPVQIASAQGSIYVLERDQQNVYGQWNTGTLPETHLAISRDNLHTMSPIDEQLVTPAQNVSNFWVNPDTGAILAEVTQYVTIPPNPMVVPHQTRLQDAGKSLWETHDDGAHWTRLSGPLLATTMIQLPHGSDPWRLCGEAAYPVGQTQSNLRQTSFSFYCTYDGGQTWVARPSLPVLESCQGGPPCPPSRAAIPGRTAMSVFLSSDGALIEAAPCGPMTNGVIDETKQQGWGVYRLPEGSTQWQFLGPLQGPIADAFAYFPQQGTGGVIWSFTGAVGGGPYTGYFGHQMYQTGIQVADLPK